MKRLPTTERQQERIPLEASAPQGHAAFFLLLEPLSGLLEHFLAYRRESHDLSCVPLGIEARQQLIQAWPAILGVST